MEMVGHLAALLSGAHYTRGPRDWCVVFESAARWRWRRRASLSFLFRITIRVNGIVVRPLAYRFLCVCVGVCEDDETASTYDNQNNRVWAGRDSYQINDRGDNRP